MRLNSLVRFFATGLVVTTVLNAQTMQAPDIKTTPTLYVMPYAHLDTQWRWEFPQSISEYLWKTMHVNFDYFEKYPHYVFNWTGANRYRLMKEYFPADYARVQDYVGKGRWYPAGSSVEEGDVNLPSAEGIFRQVLYGNEYFRKDFDGKYSAEYMLPDCFGFPASLPAILAHAGVKGFSTQKLSATWQPAPKVGGAGSIEDTPEGIPFNVGLWVGPDGSTVLAALNPGGYGSQVYSDLSVAASPMAVPVLTGTELQMFTPEQQRTVSRLRERREPNWVERIDLDGKVTGVYADYKYIGTGDIGGAVNEESLKLLEAIINKETTTLPPPPLPDFLRKSIPKQEPVKVGEGPVHVVVGPADQMFKDIKPEMQGRMPKYTGDLELINHSAGSLTSQAYHKRWVMMNENLADAAEKASLASAWLGGPAYPQKRINDAWMLALGGHFHDTGAGTATPQAYEWAWNDDVLVANQFANILTDATATVASQLDTRGAGIPLVLFNSLNVDREDLVAATVPHVTGSAKVTDADGADVPAQIVDGKVLFAAKVPSVGYAVYHVVPASAPATNSSLQVTMHSLENARYKVALNQEGEVSSIFDKSLNKELLAGPVRLALTTDNPKQYPAWNIDWDQISAAPRAYVDSQPMIRIKEHGPARVALEITREHEGSKYVQVVSLAAGDAGNRVEFANTIDWRGTKENLKAVFHLTASNPNATYNEDLGTIERPNRFDRQFEVLSHRWIDLTDKSGSFGTSILTDYKNGSDKVDDSTIRLTLLRSPGTDAGYTDQGNQDWGHHDITFGIAGHRGDWRDAGTDWQGYRLNNPIRAFATTAHSGSLGKKLSLFSVDSKHVRLFAMKKAENSDELVVRMVETAGKPTGPIHATFAAPVVQAREINAQEMPVGEAAANKGVLDLTLSAYQPRTFALKLRPAAASASATTSEAVKVKYDLRAASNDDAKVVSGFDGKGNAIPAEMLGESIDVGGVDFKLPHASTETDDAVTANGQVIELPRGNYNRVYILAASSNGDVPAEFKVGSTPVRFNVQAWNGFLGQWDTREWKNVPNFDWNISATAKWPPADFAEREKRAPSVKYPEDYLGLREGFVKPAEVAWYASHHHTAEGLNAPYQYSYLFAYSAELPTGARTLTLPKNTSVKVLAVSVANVPPQVTPAVPLFDALAHTEPPTKK
ncbi:MAG TPA: glycoside hydrolase family 38 C-terminal domain-containing protein [Acidobacteriaceae bacterium]